MTMRGLGWGLLLAAAAVAGGMTLGNGVAGQQARSGYDLTWLTDGTRGQLVQVDPTVGRANVRLQVADPGSTLSIQQGDGKLVVVDRKSGKITSIDLGTLLVGGTRTERAGDGVKVMLAGSRLYIADLPRGTVRAVDPATQANIGTPWSAGRPLVDIGVDGAHDVWALDSGQHLVTLRWNGSALAPTTTRTVEGAGPGSVIVGHDRGVTLIGSKGAIVRVGTGRDARLDAPHINGPLHGPQRSPDELVPVSDPGTSSVVIVGPRDAIVDDVSGYGCKTPAAPTVFDGLVYVPCSDAHKVLVLDANGRQVGSAIPTPGNGDPQLTVSGGHLVIDVPGTGRATVVDPSGHTRNFPTVAPGIGVQNPNTPPADPPTPPKPEPRKKPTGSHDGGSSHGNSPRTSTGGDRPGTGNNGGTTTPTPSGQPAGPSTDASAQTRPDGSVLVRWGSATGGATVVTATSTGGEVASVPAGATSATVTVLSPGTTTAFHVRNGKVDATTNSVTTATLPGATSAVSVSPQGVSNGAATLAVTWSAAVGNGAPVSYAVSAAGSASKTTGNLNASITVPCASGCSGKVTVTPRNSAGAGTAASGDYTVAAPTNPGTPATRAPAQPTQAPAPTSQAPAPPPPPAPAPVAMPTGGQSELTARSAVQGDDDAGTPATIQVTVTTSGDWTSFPGTCTLYEDGAASATVACNANGDIHPFDYDVAGTHQYWLVASDSGRTVESAHVSATARFRRTCLNSANVRSLTGAPVQLPVNCQPNCPNCQIPFLGSKLDPATVPAILPATVPTRPAFVRLSAPIATRRWFA